MRDVFHENRRAVAHTCAQPRRAAPARFAVRLRGGGSSCQ